MKIHDFADVQRQDETPASLPGNVLWRNCRDPVG